MPRVRRTSISEDEISRADQLRIQRDELRKERDHLIDRTLADAKDRCTDIRVKYRRLVHDVTLEIQGIEGRLGGMSAEERVQISETLAMRSRLVTDKGIPEPDDPFDEEN